MSGEWDGAGDMGLARSGNVLDDKVCGGWKMKG